MEDTIYEVSFIGSKSNTVPEMRLIEKGFLKRRRLERVPSSKNVAKMSQKCRKNVAKMSQKCRKNVAKMSQKFFYDHL
jgi:hypothetical protein